MPHVVKGILTVAINDTSEIAKIDNCIEVSGFNSEEIHWVKTDGYVDFHIDEAVSTATSIDTVLEGLEKLEGFKGAMWVESKELTEPYNVVYSENLTVEQCSVFAKRFFDQQQKLIENALTQTSSIKD
jgi:hypothetical protein